MISYSADSSQSGPPAVYAEFDDQRDDDVEGRIFLLFH